MNRRDFFKKIALLFGAITASKKGFAQDIHDMRMHMPTGWADPEIKISPPPPLMGKQMGRVITPNVKPLGYEMDGNIKVFTLIAQPVEHYILDGESPQDSIWDRVHKAKGMMPGMFIPKRIKGWGFHSSILGPTIEAYEGERIRIIVKNELPERTSLIRDEIEEVTDTLYQWKEHIVYRERFGFSSAIDIFMAEALLADSELEFSQIESELLIKRHRLNRILGLSTDWDINIEKDQIEKIPHLPELETLFSQALSKSPAIYTAGIEIKETDRILSLERERIFSNVQVGIAYEKAIEGDESTGPEIGLQIPIFDQNQAKIAKAEYILRQKEKELKAKIDELKEEISTIYERLSFLKEQINSLKTRILPLKEKAVEFSERYFNAMELHMLYLLEARKNLI